MDVSVQIIPLANLAYSFIPVLLVIALLVKWSLEAGNAVYSLARMVLQLILVGYVLVFIFDSNDFWITSAVIVMMIFVSSWIALRTLKKLRWQLYSLTVFSTFIGGGSVLIITVWPVLELSPFYKPQYTIPLAGMIFANSMNSMSLALDRLYAELQNGIDYIQARNTAFHTSLIPIINSMFAVGLVSLPGMMTGQVLSGVSPLIAARYQILVMCMIFASCALSTALLLVLSRNRIQMYSASY